MYVHMTQGNSNINKKSTVYVKALNEVFPSGFPIKIPYPLPHHVYRLSHVSHPNVFEHRKISNQIFSGWQPHEVVEWQVNRRVEDQIRLRRQETEDGPRNFGLFSIRPHHPAAGRRKIY